MHQCLFSFNFTLKLWIIDFGVLFSTIVKEVSVTSRARPQNMHIVNFRDAVKHIVPARSEIIAFISSQIQQCTDAFKVFLFNLSNRPSAIKNHLSEFRK
jgi:hypothetical protein